MSVRYLTTASLSRISFNVEPLCTGLISILLSMAGCWHNHTLLFALEVGQSCCTTLKSHRNPEVLLFATSLVCPAPPCRVHGVYMPPFWGAWYGQQASFTCKLNMTLKHLMTETIAGFIVYFLHYYQACSFVCCFVNVVPEIIWYV